MQSVNGAINILLKKKKKKKKLVADNAPKKNAQFHNE